MNLRQKAFSEHYVVCRNATQAARLAGYSERYAGTNADKLLKNTNVQATIAALTEQISSVRIADAKERHEFWTSVMRGHEEGFKGLEMKDRLKASELLGRAQLDFVEKVEVKHGLLEPDWEALLGPAPST